MTTQADECSPVGCSEGGSAGTSGTSTGGSAAIGGSLGTGGKGGTGGTGGTGGFPPGVQPDDPDPVPPPNAFSPPTPTQGGGGIQGEAVVTQDGAFGYTIPLQLPPGRLDVEPSLSLSYNSRAGVSIVGVGWSVSGLSQITRCPKTRATHGIADQISFHRRDAICLDGQPLHWVGGSQPLSNGSEYRAERADYSRIIAQGNDGFAPTSFTVYAKNGLILEYGLQADALGKARLGIDHSYTAEQDGDFGAPQTRPDWGQQVTYGWYLSSIRDRFDNGLRVSYIEAAPGSALRIPKKIVYGGSWRLDPANEQHSREVRFDYDTLSAVPTFTSGINTTLAARLKSVQVSAAADGSDPPHTLVPAWQYALEYVPSNATKRPLLRNVRMCDATGACAGRTLFAWDETPIWLRNRNGGRLTYHPDSYEWTNLTLADLNGDGRDDLIYAGWSGSGEPNWNNRHARLLVRLATGNRLAPFGTEVDVSHLLAQNYHGLNTHKMRVVDLNGDGAKEVVFVRGSDTWIDYNQGDHRAYAWQNNTLTQIAEFPGSGWDTLNFLDANGDSRADLVWNEAFDCQPGPCEGWKYALNPGGANPLPAMISSLALVRDASGQQVFGKSAFGTDVLSDGNFDLLSVLTTPPHKLVNVDRHGRFAYQNVGWIGWWFDTGDLNGDGLDDIVNLGTYDPGTGEIGVMGNVRYNTTLGLTAKVPILNGGTCTPHFCDGQGLINWVRDPLRVADFNGDGRGDVLHLDFAIRNPPLQDQLNGAFVSNWAAPPLLRLTDGPDVLIDHVGFRLRHFSNELLNAGPHGWTGTAIGDVDGDGLPDIVQLAHEGYYDFSLDNRRDPRAFVGGSWQAAQPPKIEVLQAQRTGRPDRITEVQDGFGRIDKLVYSSINRSTVYTPRITPCTYPQRCLNSGVDVVGEHVVYPSLPAEDADKPSTYDKFTYTDARSDMQGRGFLGFASVTRTDTLHGGTTTSTFNHGVVKSTCPGYVYPFAGVVRQVDSSIPHADGTPRTRSTSVASNYCLRSLDFATRSSDNYGTLAAYFDNEPWSGSSGGGEPNDCSVHSSLAENISSLTSTSCGVYRTRSYTIELKDKTETVQESGLPQRLVRAESYAYDLFGNVTSETTTSKRNSAPEIEDEKAEVIRTFINDLTHYLLGLPDLVTQKSTIDGVTLSVTTDYDYHPLTPALRKETRAPGVPARELVIDYERNELGLLRVFRQTDTATGISRQTTVEYDEAAMFPRRITNALGHQLWVYYYQATGELATLWNPNGFIETHRKYDGLGKLSSERSADGYEFNVSYAGLDGQLFVELLSNAGERLVSVTDGLNRPVREGWGHFDGTLVGRRRRYDDTARKTFTSLPAPWDQVGAEITVASDNFGRPLSVTQADFSAATWSYPNLYETIAKDESQHTRHILQDAAGRVIESASILAEESNRRISTTFKYWPFGEVKRVEHPGNTTTTEVDALGWVRVVNDPNFASTSYTRDAFGEVSEEIVGGRSSLYFRDQLGRPNLFIAVEGSTSFAANYIWDVCPSGIGRLCTAYGDHTNAFGEGYGWAQHDYHYDSISRLTTDAQSALGGMFADAATYTYDSVGRLKQTLYPFTGIVAPAQPPVIEREYSGSISQEIA